MSDQLQISPSIQHVAHSDDWPTDTSLTVVSHNDNGNDPTVTLSDNNGTVYVIPVSNTLPVDE